MTDKYAERVWDTLAVSRPSPHVRLIVFDRPEAANAINTRMGEELASLFRPEAFDPQLRCIVLTGSGERAFSAGGDLRERNGMTNEAWLIQHRIFEAVTFGLVDCPIPVIACVNGAAYGGGCEFALSCDMIFAVRAARFALTEARLGIMPGGGGTQQLPRAVGTRRAKELILATEPFTAEEAAEWGMVNRLFEPADLLPETLAFAERIAANAPLAVRQAKSAIDHGKDMDLRSALQFEIEAYNRLIYSEDRMEGIRAFNEKRAPRFTGK